MLSTLINNFKELDIEKLRPEKFVNDFFSAKERDVARVSEGSGWEEWPKCPVCGCPRQESEFDYLGIGIVMCPDCTHRYTDRVPVSLQEVYDSIEYEEALKTLELQQKDYRASRFGGERAQLAMDLFEDNKRSVLDIGCGWGYFLAHLKKEGFDCHGIELSKPVAELARKEYGLNISSTIIEEYTPDVKVDLITLFGVIEHIKDPVLFMTHCKRVLKDGGFILIFTPNFDSVAVRVMKEYANMVYPGQHLHHFTLTSMQKLSELVGMSVHSVCTKGIDIGDIYGLSQYHGKAEVSEFLLDQANMLQSVVDEAACGNHMRVVLKK